MKSILAFIIIVLALNPVVDGSQALAQVMSSANYKIFVDSINGGGELGTSANYKLTDTIGEVGVTEDTSSTNYKIKAGFEAIGPDQILTVNLSTNLVALGVLSPNNVVTADEVLTITTNGNGYTTTIVTDGNLRASDGSDINNVSDGTVTAGSEEFGIRTSGTGGQYNSTDTSITTTAKTIAQRTTAISANSITVTFKASVTTSTAFNSYSNIVTFSTTGNF